MRVRERKYPVRMSEPDHTPCGSKKRRKDSSFWQKKKEVAAALITSSVRKRRIEASTTSVCLVSPTRVRLLPSVAETSVAGGDLCRNLHLTFSSMDSALADQKTGTHCTANLEGNEAVEDAQPGSTEALSGMPNEGADDELVEMEIETETTEPARAAGEDSKCCTDPAGVALRPSILETIFSPVFHLFRGYGEETSTSCNSRVEQVELPEQRVESLQATAKTEPNTSVEPNRLVEFKTLADGVVSADGTTYASSKVTPHCSAEATTPVEIPTSTWDDSAHEDSIMAPCSIQMSSSAEDIAACRFDPCVGLPSAEDQSLSMKPSSENCVVPFVDSTGDCIDWDPLDDRAVGDDERPAQDRTHCDADVLASDDADLFLAVEHAKSLECNDEGSHEGEAVVEEDDEFEDIDPYLFIKRLPSLSEVVSPSRPLLLPRQTRRSPPITLVLDLDETLVHSTLELCDDADFSFPVNFDYQEHMVYVRRRPHLQDFMERVAQLFEIIVFTASQSVYAEQLLNVLDPKRKLIRHRIFRDSCVFVRGNYLKDLTILGRDLSKVAIIDNSPQAYGFQVDNGIPIESWFDDRTDSALATLLPFLETLVGVDDVRPIIAKRFNLRGKIAAAAEMPYLTNRGDPLDRFS
ncbi:unnamed protein product [Calypogeia fissa]